MPLKVSLWANTETMQAKLREINYVTTEIENKPPRMDLLVKELAWRLSLTLWWP